MARTGAGSTVMSVYREGQGGRAAPSGALGEVQLRSLGCCRRYAGVWGVWGEIARPARAQRPRITPALTGGRSRGRSSPHKSLLSPGARAVTARAEPPGLPLFSPGAVCASVGAPLKWARWRLTFSFISCLSVKPKPGEVL